MKQIKLNKLAVEYTKLQNRHERTKKLLSLILDADTNPRRKVKLTKYYRKKIRKELS